MTSPGPERSRWREYRSGDHAWSAIRELGMQRSKCGYLVSSQRLAKSGGRRCLLCACIVDRDFRTAPHAGAADSIARLREIRRSGDHVVRAVRVLEAATLDAAVCAEAVAKLTAVQADLISLFRLERAGTSNTLDDESLAQGDADGLLRNAKDR